jgi:predicted dehydrogenase
MSLLKVLHVGVAGRGIWPLKLCNADTSFVPAALCDSNETSLQQAREKTGLPALACFTNLDEAIARSNVDCMIVCTPTIFHVPMAKKAIAAKLPVLIEKGMAPDWINALDLADTAKEKNALVAVAQNYRYSAMERTIWQCLHDVNHPAHPGAVHMITYTQQRVRPEPRTLNYPFASVWDMSCHHFDNLIYWLAQVEQMSAFSWRTDWSKYSHDNNTAAHIVMENGAHAHYIHTHDAARASLEVQIHGQRGALFRVDDQLTFSERPLEQFGTRPIAPVPLIEAHGEADLLRDFHAYITQGREPGISVANNLQTMAACEMMVRSISEHRTVRREELNMNRQDAKLPRK